ncbi:putative two-component response regulator [Gordonia hirsuta DSM 44140 = NBRC 16056]|uniref:Putative two-component response regulator n=1 Tax=Gordonia hirsuta DSM 44140 = NBRC 16056 TaxID=1121927 RepID=L7LAZ3_9ACTN|nr:response regulator transcription factor [Gordonia hirsuta]GAC57203.1 putative two-component response regulator [Gordonia hirsuta DSM 44140 = NBRC 16056]
MIRLLLADDHPIVRAGLRALLAQHADRICLAGDVATGADAVEFCRTHEVDLVLMDLRFGEGMSGADATRQIRALPTPPYVLVVTNYDTDADILGAIEAGASGYLLKDAAPDELIGAVVAAAGGTMALSPAVAIRLMHQRHNTDPQLTEREREVLRAVSDGRSNRDIARTLYVSEGTVKAHMTNIFSKLEVRSRTAAVAAARRRGILAP